jgi:hypothetical protein
MERKEEKMLMLGPIVERQHTEFADVIIEQSLDALMDEPDFPMLPPEVMEQIGEYKIEYVSVLAQAQKMAGIQAIQRTAEFAGNLAQGFPTVLDKVDADQMLDEFHEGVGGPVSIIRSDDDVAEIRENRAAEEAKIAEMQEQMAAQQMQGEQINQGGQVLQNAKTAGEALKGASETDVEALMQKIQGA